MTFAIAGVSGHTGQVAAQALLDAGEQVRVIVRDAAKGEAWARRGAEVAVADLGDAAALARALQGVEGAYLLIPPNGQAKSFVAYQEQIGKAMVDAVRRSQVPLVVFLSSIGAEKAAGTGPIRALGVVERELAKVPSTVTVAVRAAYFMENLGGALGMLGQGVLPTFLGVERPVEMIATRDIGQVVAATLRQRPEKSAVLELSAARPYTMKQVAQALSQVTGKTVTARHFPMSALVPTFTGMGWPLELAELYREMHEGFESGHIAFEGGHARLRGPTALETVLAGLIQVAAPADAHPA
jgi:uncharacterized protein YbjT (DUF2867 family)